MPDPIVEPASTDVATRRLSRRQLGGLAIAVAGAGLLRPGAASAATAPTARGHAIEPARRPLSSPQTQGQPYASAWFPEQLIGWKPSKQPDLPFLRSTTPLAPRIVDQYTTSNKHAQPYRVLACSAFDHTSGNPAQGGPVFDYYTSEFWTYIDTLIFWGGSASEGIILAPNPTVMDAAHRNGVPVVGTLYFPPDAYGGQLQWVEDLLTKRNGTYPVAKALADIAHAYGFDGWFFNQETDGCTPEQAHEMVRFLKATAAHGTGVLWYDAMTISGEIAYQEQLDSQNAPFFRVSEGMFIDFSWSPSSLESSVAYAKQLHREPDELFAGIDVGSAQFGAQYQMSELFPATGATGIGVALYRPDFTLSGAGDPDEFQQRENEFWVGVDDDPATSKPDSEGWLGMSTEIAEHTTVSSMPFVSAFGTGRGHGWWQQGRRWQQNDWNNLSAQDVLPTWRWIVTGSRLKVAYDFADAWQGSQSVRIRGTLSAPATMPLYATRVEVTNTTALGVVMKGGVTLAAVLRFLDEPDNDVVVPMGTADTTWTTLSTGPLGAYGGRTLIRLGLELSGSGTIDARLGWLQLLDGPASTPTRPGALTAKASGAGYRMRWTGQPNVRYDVEAISPQSSRFWLGTTTSDAFYAYDMPSTATAVAVVPIAADGTRGPQARASL